MLKVVVGLRPEAGRDFVRSVVLLGWGRVPGAHADVCNLGGLSGVVRAAVKAKGRVPS